MSKRFRDAADAIKRDTRERRAHQGVGRGGEETQREENNTEEGEGKQTQRGDKEQMVLEDR